VDRLCTPDDRFEGLPGYDFEPHFVEVAAGRGDPLRMHYVDAGPRGAAPVLLLHGQPTWSYLYRRVIADLAGAGHRVVAPDHIGFGRSDKPADRTAYTYERHVRWVAAFVEALDLVDLTMVVQDWGGPIGLAVATRDPGRVARVVATNTALHTADAALAGRTDWAVHAVGGGRVVLQEALVDYVAATQRAPRLEASVFIRLATQRQVPPDVLRAYDAPFPDERYQAGMRQFPSLIPLTTSDPGAAIGRSTTEALSRWDRPFLTAFSDGDPPTRGWDRVLQDLVPGAAGQPHTTIAGAGHYVQEDRGPDLARVIDAFIAATRGP